MFITLSPVIPAMDKVALLAIITGYNERSHITMLLHYDMITVCYKGYNEPCYHHYTRNMLTW